MIRFTYIPNVKYPYGTQHYYFITLCWCCVLVDIMVDVGNDNYVSDINRNDHYLSDITFSIVEIIVDIRNDNCVSNCFFCAKFSIT